VVRTVLVVNDSPDSLEMMSLLLSRAGYSVLTAFDGQEGFEVASRERPRLVISDVSMPRADGIELCRLTHSKNFYVKGGSRRSETISPLS
jgi:CheY-like chemotaxis protein